jgi:hypothetical protein
METGNSVISRIPGHFASARDDKLNLYSKLVASQRICDSICGTVNKEYPNAGENVKKFDLRSAHVASDKLEIHVYVVKSVQFFPVQVPPDRKLFHSVASGASVHNYFHIFFFQNNVSHAAHDCHL